MFHLLLTSVEAGEFEQRFNQPPHALRRALAGLERFAIFRRAALAI
jgi:hypothetical protein